MSKIYFGGSRSQSHPLVPSVVSAVVASGHSVHVGCQSGIDNQVTHCALNYKPSSLFVFAVAATPGEAPQLVQFCNLVCSVAFAAGGTSAPIHARYLLRSIAAFQGCSQAVFFQPGPGSLAVARECIKAGLPVFAFGDYPAPIPQSHGFWVSSSFQGFECFQWQLTATQPKLF